MYKGIEIIAEVKTRSPFGWQSAKSWDELFAIADDVGDTVSIHTDPRWGGSFHLLKKARGLTNKPLLAKGIHASDEDISRALDCGADLVLVVGRVPGAHLDKCLVEPASLEGLARLATSQRAVWNSRDLTTGGLKSTSFSEARQLFGGWLCQASNIISLEDINAAADAVLIGTNLSEIAEQLEHSS